MHITTVTKRDGSVEPFVPEKLNKWAEYATQSGGSWSEIAMATFKRLSDGCTTSDIHETMIDVCLDMESIEYSRVASRLEYAFLRKNMKKKIGVHDKMSFESIFNAMIYYGVWDKKSLPPFNPVWNKWYEDISDTYLEYWQVKQWSDKYSARIDDVAVETPHVGVLAIALGVYGDCDKAFKYAKAIIEGKINLPTPVMNGVRNGDFDSISCCVISGGDSVESIGVADHIAYRMTAKKAGIGIEFTTRSKGDSVKGGRVRHLGKHPIYKMLDRSVKAMTQITRGGNATVTMLCIDPEIENIISWKSQRVDIETRIDKLDFSMGYNDAFVDAVVKDSKWYLFSLIDAPEIHESFYTASVDEYNLLVSKKLMEGVPHKEIMARDLLKKFLTIRQETGRFYDINLSRTNIHTPFNETIRLSNLCQEIALVTKPYPSMKDLYSSKSQGETAFCSLSAINVMKTTDDEYEEIAGLALEAVDILIDKAPMMTKSMKESIMRRRSVGIGITGLAGRLYQMGFDYDGSEASLNYVQSISERHYFYLLKASQRLSEESGIVVEGVNFDWLPIDTAINKSITGLDWESLRGKPRKNSVLVAHMPTESSAVFSGAPNGLYPVRQKVINKRSRKGIVQYICEPFVQGKNLTAWDIDNITLSKYYGRVQDYTDQAISCDFYVQPSKFEGGKVPMSLLIKEWVAHAKLGNKTKYYVNTNDSNGGSIQDIMASRLASVSPNSDLDDEDGCESCKL